jgi:hypothetical protein
MRIPSPEACHYAKDLWQSDIYFRITEKMIKGASIIKLAECLSLIADVFCVSRFSLLDPGGRHGCHQLEPGGSW